jgi:predicted ferric reductase
MTACTLIRIFSEVYIIKLKQKVITPYTLKVTQLRGLKAQPFMFLCTPTKRFCGFSSGTAAHGHHFGKTRNFESVEGNASLCRTIMCCRNVNGKENTSTI